MQPLSQTNDQKWPWASEARRSKRVASLIKPCGSALQNHKEPTMPDKRTNIITWGPSTTPTTKMGSICKSKSRVQFLGILGRRCWFFIPTMNTYVVRMPPPPIISRGLLSLLLVDSFGMWYGMHWHSTCSNPPHKYCPSKSHCLHNFLLYVQWCCHILRRSICGTI